MFGDSKGTACVPILCAGDCPRHSDKHCPTLVSGLRGGDMTLLFGCRQPDLDHIYREETEEMQRKGVLKDIYTAYSRLPGQEKVRLVPFFFKG